MSLKSSTYNNNIVNIHVLKFILSFLVFLGVLEPLWLVFTNLPPRHKGSKYHKVQ